MFDWCRLLTNLPMENKGKSIRMGTFWCIRNEDRLPPKLMPFYSSIGIRAAAYTDRCAYSRTSSNRLPCRWKSVASLRNRISLYSANPSPGTSLSSPLSSTPIILNLVRLLRWFRRAQFSTVGHRKETRISEINNKLSSNNNNNRNITNRIWKKNEIK